MGLLDHGDALWEPAPIYSYKRVKLGDVGYIRRGRFHLLFSAGCPLGSRKLGVHVPPTFEPLDVGPVIYSQPRLPGYLCTSSVKEAGGSVGASVNTTPFLEPGASFSFELTEKQGAALVTKHRTYREDIEHESAFEEYIKRHYDSWVAFARNARHGNDIKPVLVTGVDMTRDFAMIAYSNNGTHLSSEFTTSVPLLASASIAAWGTWNTQGMVYTNCGPQLCSPPSPGTPDSSSADIAQIDTTPNEYNQCVFIRYYTIRKRALMFPKVVKAAAGPHDLGSGNNHDGTLPELAVQSDSGSDTGSYSSGDSTDCSSSIVSCESNVEVFRNFSSEEDDVLDIVADYIFENSGAQVVLIHHRDISRIREDLPGSEISEVFMKCQPEIVVGSDGIGRVMRRSSQRWAVDPFPKITTRRQLPGLPSGQPPRFHISLNGEDVWILSRGLILLTTRLKGTRVSSLNADTCWSVSGALLRAPISGIMSIGTLGFTGMYMGQSTMLSKSLLAPLSLLPSSWQTDPVFVMLRGGVPEEILLAFLAKEHLGIEPARSSSEELLRWGDTLFSVKHAGANEKGSKKKGTQRHSMPQPAMIKKRDRLIPRHQSLWFKPRKTSRGDNESESTPGNQTCLRQEIGDLDGNSSRGNSWRYSARSATSNKSNSSLQDSRPTPGYSRSSDRFSLTSDESSSSLFTRISTSTLSTFLTAPSSSRRSSKGSLLQREKRFSSIKPMDSVLMELDEMSPPGTPELPATPDSASSSSRLPMAIVPRNISTDGGSNNMMDQGVLPPTKPRERKYSSSLASILRKRVISDETCSAGTASESETSSSSLGRRARFKRFFKDILKI